MQVTDIRDIRKVRDKYAALRSYIDLLDRETARYRARLEELRKKKQETKEKQK